MNGFCLRNETRAPRVGRAPAVFRAGATLLLLFFLSAGQASAAFGPLAKISNAGKRPFRGDTLTVESNWPDGPGYRPVRFQLDCRTASAADRTLTIEFQTMHWYGPSGASLTATFDFDIPAGSVKAIKDVSVPQYYPWQMFRVSVSEDGRQNDELTGMSLGATAYGQWQPQTPNMLMIGEWPAGKDLSAFANMTGMSGGYSTNPSIAGGNPAIPAGNPNTGPQNFTSPNLHLLAPGELPTNWVTYSGLDVICISLDELEKLKSSNADAWSALRNWTAHGGNLWIHGVADPSKQTRADELLDLPPAWSDAKYITDGPRWRPTAGNPGYAVEAGAYALRDFQRGSIVGIKKQFDEIAGSNYWNAVRDEVGMDRYLWHRRYGVSLQQGNPEFWNFLIPDVGLAPVNAYRLLITLFVVAIGPINYGLLQRYRRLHLLMFTVPASAVLVAASLIGYALAADGIGTRLRARSFTEIDQRRGEATTMGRLSYYAGLAPSGGLRFPNDTVVFPIESDGAIYYRRNAGQRRQLSLTDEQHMSRGWLNSRTHTQYMVGRISDCDMKLDISNTGGVVRVKNRLGADIQHLLLCDEQGHRHYASNLADEATTDLQAIAAELTGNDQPPFDAISQAYASAIPRDTRPYAVTYVTPQPPMQMPDTQDDPNRVSTTSSRMELALQEHLQNPGQRIRPRSYIAVVGSNPHLPLGVDSGTETGSYHVIVGYW
jgi:hypothetical protein